MKPPISRSKYWSFAVLLSILAHISLAYFINFQEHPYLATKTDKPLKISFASYTQLKKSQLKNKEVNNETKKQHRQKIKANKKNTFSKPNNKPLLKPEKKLLSQVKSTRVNKKNVAKTFSPSAKFPPKKQAKITNTAQQKLPPNRASAPKSAYRRNNVLTGDDKKKKAISEYAKQLQKWLEKNKRYPVKAIRRKLEGTVVLIFTISHHGVLLSHRIKQSSGHNILDEETKKILIRSQPFPQMPKNMEAKQWEFTIPINYKLF